MASLQDDYDGTFHASSLAKWFHTAPHKDLDLEDTTTIFSPSDESYREALYVLAIFISSFGAFLFLLIVLYYTCCYCICRQSGGRRQNESLSCCKKACLQLQVFILALICCGALVTGFIYNGKTSDGVDMFRNSVDDIQSDINHASSLGNNMNSILQRTKSNICYLSQVSPYPAAKEACDLSFKMIGSLDAINGLLPQHVVNESSHVGDKVHKYDNYRWLTTVLLLSWCILLCISLFWIGCQVNGCMLVLATIFCLLTVLLTWAFTGADFAIATGIGDFCVHPKEAIETIKKGSATSIVISYYMDCSGAEYDPFSENLRDLHKNLTNVTDLIGQIPGHQDLKRLIIRDLTSVKSNLSLYQASFQCNRIHKEYMNAMNGLCEKTLNSLGIVMLAVLVIAFFSGLLTCCICPLWKYRHPSPTVYNDVRDPHDGVGWFPHNVDANPGRHGEPTERSPLIANQHPNYDQPQIPPNLNFIHINYNHNAEHDRQPDNRDSVNRHSF